jgi:hypothetical protein
MDCGCHAPIARLPAAPVEYQKTYVVDFRDLFHSIGVTRGQGRLSFMPIISSHYGAGDICPAVLLVDLFERILQ